MPTRRMPFTDAAIEEAAGVILAGRLVAFPTETVYGLGARADRSDAVRRIFEAKGRPSGNPLIVHVAGIDAAIALTSGWPAIATTLAQAFWPGPLTMIVKGAPGAVAPEVRAGGPTVGLRVPAHPAALALLRATRVPIAAPSANRSTTISPTTADHVLKTLTGAVDLVLDAGPTGFGIESTIVDVTRPVMRVLRHGAIPLAALRPFGEVSDAAHGVVAETDRAEAPGMLRLHYAPRAKAHLALPEEVASRVIRRRQAGKIVGAIERAAGSVSAPVEVLPADAEGFGREIYAALHRLDDAGCDEIVIARVPDDAAWDAVRDRLERATS